MALPMKTQLRYWGIGFVFFVLVMWLLGNILAPFLLGMAMAYFLDPVADRLESWGFSRVWATITITFFGVLAAVIFLAAVVPQLISQLSNLIIAAPVYFDAASAFLSERFPSLFEVVPPAADVLSDGTTPIPTQDSPRLSSDLLQGLRDQTGKIANAVLTGATSVLNGVVFLVVAPVVSFYMLMDWDRMVAKIDSLLPRDHRDEIRKLARELDRTMAGFIRGQVSVCSILGVFYALALMLVGLQFGLIVGLIAGALTFIPYVGSLVGGALSIGLALFQFWGQPEMIILVAAIFAIGQFIEGNILTPRLVGGSVGLHPVWLIFALSAFGALMGFAGMLIAVPVAAAIGVFVRFGIERYSTSPLYMGEVGKAEALARAEAAKEAKPKKKTSS